MTIKKTAKTAEKKIRRTPVRNTVKSKLIETPDTKSGEQLVIENLATMSQVVKSLAETLETLVQKVENMAHHIIADEEIIAELIASNGINLAKVNARIRKKIFIGTDNTADSSKAIDIAASIASPAPNK